MKLGIRPKLVLYIILAVVLLQIVYNFSIYDREYKILSNQLQEKTKVLLKTISTPLAVDLVTMNLDSIDSFIVGEMRKNKKKENENFKELIDLVILDIDGRFIGHTDVTMFGKKATDNFYLRALERDQDIQKEYKQEKKMEIAVPIFYKAESSRYRVGTIIAKIDMKSIETVLNGSLVENSISSIFFILLTGGIIYLSLSKLVIKPMNQIKIAAGYFKKGDFKHRIHLESGDEFEELSDIITDMCRKIKEHNRELEKKVSLRTMDLKKANQALKNSNEQLERLAITDGLTGLYNHRYFQETLRNEIQRSERSGRSLGLLIMDVDYFKKFNDTFGHPAGDAILKGIADLLTKHLRRIDTAARYGGEEFVAILPETTKDESQITAEKIREIIEKHRFIEEKTVTISIGVASYPENGKNSSELIQAADRALYQAKVGGRNQVVVYGNSKTIA